MAGTRGVFAERVSQGFYINVKVNRAAAARYGLTVGDVQTRGGIGDRRRQYRDHRGGTRALSDQRAIPAGLPRRSRALRQVLIMTPAGAQIPLGEVADVSRSAPALR